MIIKFICINKYQLERGWKLIFEPQDDPSNSVEVSGNIGLIVGAETASNYKINQTYELTL